MKVKRWMMSLVVDRNHNKILISDAKFSTKMASVERNCRTDGCCLDVAFSCSANCDKMLFFFFCAFPSYRRRRIVHFVLLMNCEIVDGCV